MKPSLFIIFGAAALIVLVGVFVYVGGSGQKRVVSPSTEPHLDVSRPSGEETPGETIPVDYEAIRERFAGKDVERVPMEEKLMALTFDGGGNANGTERILETLARENISSTFFLTGNFIERFPESVDTIVKAGHEIANHTLSHRNFKELASEEVFLEIAGAKERALAKSIMFAPFFRFPYGEYKKGDIALVNDGGYVAVRWTVDSWGWKGKGEGIDAAFVANKVISASESGAIVLMHVGSARDSSTLDADALPEIIRTLSAQGYRFVTLSELFSRAQ